MTEKEGKLIVEEYISSLTRRTKWWESSDRNIDLLFTYIHNPYPGQVFPPLRDELSFPHFVMTKRGLDFGDLFYAWDEVYGTGIKTETFYAHGEFSSQMYHLIFCLADGTVKEYMLGNLAYLNGLLTHYIELYKLEFKKSK